MKTHRYWRALPALILAAFAFPAATASAQQPPLISRDILFGNPERT